MLRPTLWAGSNRTLQALTLPVTRAAAMTWSDINMAAAWKGVGRIWFTFLWIECCPLFLSLVLSPVSHKQDHCLQTNEGYQVEKAALVIIQSVPTHYPV